MVDEAPVAPSLEELLNKAREVSLHKLCLPHSLGPAAASELEHSVARERHLAPGARLFRQGEAFQALYVVAKGLLKTVLTDGGEVDQITGFFFPHDLIGLDALHDGTCICSAIAVEPSVVHMVPVERLTRAMSEAPTLRQGIERLMAGMLAEHEQLLAVVNQRPALERLAVFFYSLSCRLGHGGEAASELTLSMMRPEIANYLGVATETASRSIAELRTMGILDGYGKQVRIVDPQRLRWLALKGGK